MQFYVGLLGYAMVWFVFLRLKWRMVMVRDVFRREWDDVRLALSGARVSWVVLLMVVALSRGVRAVQRQYVFVDNKGSDGLVVCRFCLTNMLRAPKHLFA